MPIYMSQNMLIFSVTLCHLEIVEKYIMNKTIMHLKDFSGESSYVVEACIDIFPNWNEDVSCTLWSQS